MSNNIKILHLEDSPSDAILIGKAIKKEIPESEILVVDTKKKYCNALKDFPADIILSDHSLPSFDSHEALQLAHDTGLSIPFILVTAAMSDEFAANSIKRGADDYILKDRMLRLPSAIKNALEKFRLQQEKEIYLNHLLINEKKYRGLIENGADIVAILNADFKSIYISPSIKHILGYSEEEALLLNLSEIVHPSDKEAIFEKMTECLAKPGVTIVGREGRILHKNGTWRWMEATLTNLLHDPAINGIVDNFRDITERKLAEEALKESEDKYRSFFENSQDGIFLAKIDGTILGANLAACNIFQRTEADICLLGRNGLVDKTDPRLALALKEIKHSGKFIGELTFVRRDGSKFTGEITSSIFKDALGKDKTSMLIRDISERKRAETDLKDSEEQYRRLFQLSPLPKWIFELDTLNIVDVNEIAITHYGFSREE